MTIPILNLSPKRPKLQPPKRSRLLRTAILSSHQPGKIYMFGLFVTIKDANTNFGALKSVLLLYYYKEHWFAYTWLSLVLKKKLRIWLLILYLDNRFWDTALSNPSTALYGVCLRMYFMNDVIKSILLLNEIPY